MAILKYLLLAAATSIIATVVVAETPSDANLRVKSEWHEAFGKGYQLLAGKAEQFSSVAGDYCATPGTPNARAKLEQAWLEAFLAWQSIRFVDFGPVETNNLAWQFQFWPDPKNLVARKAGYLLAPDEPVSRETVARSGVAVQGFPMAEYLLFDEQLNDSDKALPANNTCRLLAAVAAHIENNSTQLTADWQTFKEHYMSTESYRDTTIRAAMTALEILEERRLARPMGLHGNGKRSHYAADAWRSGTSSKAIEATIAGLRQHFVPGMSSLLIQSSQPELADRILDQFEEVLENFPGIYAPMSSLLAEDKGFSRLQNFYVDISQLTTLVNDQAAVELGVIRGFNSSDGD